MAANTWDDSQWSPEEVAEAESIVQAHKTRLPATVAADHASKWDGHYTVNVRNYNDRRYLLNEFPQLAAAAQSGEERLVIEAGCGAGNSIFPLLAAAPNFRVLGFDLSECAVRLSAARLQREGLSSRARAFVWDVGNSPPPRAELGSLPVAHVALAIFTLSALSPDALSRAMTNLYDCLLPGGELLLRDYGRLDLKQLKFARSTSGGRLISDGDWEWYARGDGTTVVFFSEEQMRGLAAAAGFVVDQMSYDKRLVLNRAEGTRMQRVWLTAVLRKPGTKPGRQQRWWPLIWSRGLPASVAAVVQSRGLLPSVAASGIALYALLWALTRVRPSRMLT